MGNTHRQNISDEVRTGETGREGERKPQFESVSNLIFVSAILLHMQQERPVGQLPTVHINYCRMVSYEVSRHKHT